MAEDQTKTERTFVDDTLTKSMKKITPGNGVDSILNALPQKPQNRYRFLRSIGFGGMKTVLLVHDNDTDRDIAMALMPDFKERSGFDQERFVKEALLTAKLEHPNIVPVHDIGVDSTGSPYFTMKFLHGQSLETLLKKLKKGDPETVSQYGLERLLQIFTRICNAIEFAHSKGICHLDLKPSNISLGEYGEVQVIDWGLARPFNTIETHITKQLPNGQHVVSGTPGFMSPEQIHNSLDIPVGKRSDIYSLGCILYSMLALSHPLEDCDLHETFRRTVTGNIPRPSKAAPEDRHVPSAIEAVCLKAMALRQTDRYRDVWELREDVFAFLTGFVPKAENASALKHAGLFINRNLLIILLLLCLGLTTALIAVLFK